MPHVFSALFVIPILLFFLLPTKSPHPGFASILFCIRSRRNAAEVCAWVTLAANRAVGEKTGGRGERRGVGESKYQKGESEGKKQKARTAQLKPPARAGRGKQRGPCFEAHGVMLLVRYSHSCKSPMTLYVGFAEWPSPPFLSHAQRSAYSSGRAPCIMSTT